LQKISIMSIAERIIKESMDLFTRQGVRAVTMDDIARYMGVSKRTIYENFKDKDQLIKSCILWHKDQQNHMKQKIFSTSSNVLESFYRLMYQFMIAMKSIHPSFITDIKKYHFQICEKLIIQYQSESIQEIETLIELGKTDLLFRRDVNTEITARILNLQLRALSDEQVFSPEKYSIAEVYSNVVVNFTRGIATEKGLRVIDELIEKWNNNELII
jgi:TetR/AcrR family transcriptional regulator, cholesterol catabolism regulator